MNPNLAEEKRTREILRSRARELAKPIGNSGAAGELVQVIEFRLAMERYGVEQKYVREVQPLRELTPLACTPAFVCGLINVRGRILPVIDIKKFFDLPEGGITDLHMVIIVHRGEVDLGILADAVAGVAAIAPGDIQPSLPTLTGVRAKYLLGVTEQRLVILDVAKILDDPRIVVEEEVPD